MMALDFRPNCYIIFFRGLLLLILGVFISFVTVVLFEGLVFHTICDDAQSIANLSKTQKLGPILIISSSNNNKFRTKTNPGIFWTFLMLPHWDKIQYLGFYEQKCDSCPSVENKQVELRHFVPIVIVYTLVYLCAWLCVLYFDNFAKHDSLIAPR